VKSVIKNLIATLLCATMLLCLVACGSNSTASTQTSQSKTQDTSIPKPATSSSPDTLRGEDSTNAPQESKDPKKPFFKTEDISRITFYAYYGAGKGITVPTEYLTEITNWLATFIIDETAPDLLPPGTNTYCVEIEYSDGTVVESGLDVTTVDGVAYHLKSHKAPACFMQIISKTDVE
jgi:hypothetical protein